MRKVKQWLYMLALLSIPLSNVQADAEKTTTSLIENILGNPDVCQASYDENGVLNVPCVLVTTGNETVSYHATLKRVSENSPQFALESATQNEFIIESPCTSYYNLDSGKLDIKCLNGNGNTTLYSDVTESSIIFLTSSNNGRQVRGNDACPYNSGQSWGSLNWYNFTDYGYANPLDSFVGIKQGYGIGSSGYLDHLGVDWFTPAYSPIYAICDGIITSDSQDATYQQVQRGRNLELSYFNARIILKCDGGNNMLAIYGHVDGQTVSAGTKVNRGQQIGFVTPAYKNATERSPGLDHLHFGIRTGYSAPYYKGVGFGIATENVTLAQAESQGFQDPLNYLCSSPTNNTSGIKTYFDGAGSIVRPGQNCYGCNKDIAMMHPHGFANQTSTVVFQWLYDENSCDHLDISASSDIDVMIHSKAWSDHLTGNVFRASLPVSLDRPSSNGWTTFAVTSTNFLNDAVSITATCAGPYQQRIGSLVDMTDYSNDENNLVPFDFDYFWTGNGSLISNTPNGYGVTSYGVTQDDVVTFSTHKSLSVFQWYRSDYCPSITIGASNDDYVWFNGEDEVAYKYWDVDASGWNQASCSYLPCTIAPTQDDYYIVKVKTDSNAVSSGYISAKCN